MQLYEIKPSTADYRSRYFGPLRRSVHSSVHCPHFVRPSKVPRGNRNQCDLTQNSPVHNWPFVDLWRWNADTELFSQPLNLPWVLWTRGQQPSRSRILPSCDQYTCLPCDSLALENKLELPCMAFPGKFNELQERNVANYSMPNFPSFVYLFIYSWILQYVDGFLFLSILLVCFQGFICRKILDLNCQWRLSIGMRRICFYYFDGLAEKLRHTSVLLRVLNFA